MPIAITCKINEYIYIFPCEIAWKETQIMFPQMKENYIEFSVFEISYV